MEGFGSEELKCSPFNYGSVQDGMYGADTLEKKLKKQYWKAKQSVIEKLGKSQDEFVVAGDADIDIKLEVRLQLTTGKSRATLASKTVLVAAYRAVDLSLKLPANCVIFCVPQTHTHSHARTPESLPLGCFLSRTATVIGEVQQQAAR